LRAVFSKRPLFKRPYPKMTPVFVPDPRLSGAFLAAALRDAIANVPVKEKMPETIIKKAMTIEEMIGGLMGRVQAAMKLSFKEWSGHGGKPDKEKKVFVIVSFLAILELVKQGLLAAKQDDDFGDIEVSQAAQTA
ncbi:hypothetical protein KW797_04315, partial [Candidatus Parcubacteria bacterium]|nr:hypothetical protein [Candidatus Parcubacteria bacterium]